jgi:glycosyltransferase involved in cell wall biosynthesis
LVTQPAAGAARKPFSKPRRVLIIVENLPLPFDRRVWQEANTLKAAGYEVSIICPTGKGYEDAFETLNGIDIYRHHLPIEAHGAKGYLLEYGAALFHEMRLALKVAFGKGFDAIHACNPPDLIFLVALPFKWFAGKRFLFDHHDINPELYVAKFDGRKDFFWKLLKWCERRTFRTADVVISTNQSYRQIAIDRGGKAPGDVYVVRSGPSLDRVRILPADPAAKRGADYLIGYVGVIGQQEGIQYLLEAMRILVRDRGRTEVKCTIIGGGSAADDMRALSASMGLADVVEFTGRVSDDELLRILNTADVCVNPDEYNEMNDKSTMNKIVEYMALGKPIVQFDLAEGRVSDDRASLYAKPNDAVDMADKIEMLLADPALRADMGAFGRQRVVDTLEWRHQEPILLAAYDHLFQGR